MRARSSHTDSSSATPSGGRRKGVTTKPAGGSRSRPSKACQMRSSSTRSTWQDTTAYRCTSIMQRIFAARRPDVAVVVAAAVVPRLAVLLYERSSILSSFVEKSDTFARTFVASGTYGFVPGIPSAWTQPLYGWFLIPLYWLAGRTWEAVGLAQIVV